VDEAAAPGAPAKVVLKQGGGISIPSSLLSLALLAAMAFYFYVRVAFTLDTGVLGYSIFVLVVEVLAASSMLPHLLYLLPKKARPAHQLHPCMERCFDQLSLRMQGCYFKLCVKGALPIPTP